MPENGAPRKSLSFFLSSNRTAENNGNRSPRKFGAFGRAASLANGSRMNAAHDDTSGSPSQQDESDISTVESPTQRLSFRVLNPDPQSGSSSTGESEDEMVEEIRYREDSHIHDKTAVPEEDDDGHAPSPSTAPPQPPVHAAAALSTPPATESSSSSPDMRQKPAGDSAHWYLQGWKVAGTHPEESAPEEQQKLQQRQSKVMELEESLPSTPQLIGKPRASMDTLRNSWDGGSSASPLSSALPMPLPMPMPMPTYPQQQPAIYQDPRRLRHPPRAARSRPMAAQPQQQILPPRHTLALSYGQFVAPSTASLSSPGSTTSTAARQHKHPQQHPAAQSKYAKASYSLINHPDAIKIYRTMAEKTRDPMVQLTYAKYLLEIAALYDGHQSSSSSQQSDPSSSSSVCSSDAESPGRPLSLDRHDPAAPRASLDSVRSAPTAAPTHRLSDASRRKKKMLQDEGVRWIKLLAKQKVGEAAYLQARWLDNGEHGLSKNSAKAFKLYKVAAAEFVPEAMYQVGRAYEKTGNTVQALSNYRGAAEKDVVQAIYRMAKIHLLGELGQRQNTFLGLELLVQAADHATEHCPEPPYLLGLMLTGTYPRVELSTDLVHRYGGELAAMRHIEHAAQLGFGHAQTRIAHIYEYGLYGAPMHLAKSFGYYDMAAREHDQAQAMLGLSRLYNRGCRGPADVHTEEEKLARDVSGWLAATTRNEDAAFNWCQKAADRGLGEAMFLLGWYYETGVGVLRDYERAQEYYQKAADKGHAGAIERLQAPDSVTRQQHEGTKRHIRAGTSSNCILM